ncbi:hypothetical protein TNCV_282451, partial [Trichonephila clavipes]
MFDVQPVTRDVRHTPEIGWRPLYHLSKKSGAPYRAISLSKGHWLLPGLESFT